MSSCVWHVVGDRFGAFARNPNVITASELLRRLREPGAFDFSPEVRFIAGQGLRAEQAGEILAEGRAAAAACFSHWSEQPLASPALAHKKQRENILITVPRRVENNAFESELVLDEDNNVFSDRTTGQHLEAVILIEAARQLFVAAAELLLGFPENGKDTSFALTVLNSAYLSYVFPLRTLLRARVERQTTELESDSVVSLHAMVDGTQGRRCVFQLEARYVAYPRSFLSSIESARARQAVTSYAADW